MINLLRSKNNSVRILLGVLLGLVAISMLVYLIPGGPGSSVGASGDSVIASVGGDKLLATDVQRALQSISRGQTLPKGLLAMYAPTVVDQMIASKAMAYKARELGLQVSDQELGDFIQNEFSQQVGKFDMSIYQNVLAQQGLTIADFEARQREGMLGARLEALESRSLVVSDADLRAEYQRKNLKIALQYVAFNPKDYESKVDRNSTALHAYFDKNRAAFQIPEKRSADLVYGSATQLIQSVQIPESDLKKTYTENIDSYRQPERVQVRHILIKTQGKPKGDVPKLRAKADDLLKQLQSGAKFDELAKNNSEDPGSAAKGGELGYITKGQTVPNFEKAAFALQPNQLSGVIETEYGFHILQGEGKQEAHTQTFEEVRPQLLADAQKQAAAELLKRSLDSAQAELRKAGSDAVAIAAKYHLKYAKVDGYSSGGAFPEIGTAPQLGNAVTSVSKGATTEVVELDAQKGSAVARVLSVVPGRKAEFAEVQGQVTGRYVEEESRKLAEQAAKAAADRARKGESLDAIAKSDGTGVKTAAPFTIDGAAEGIGAASLFANAFKSNVGEIVGPVEAQNSQFVCRVSEKIAADMTAFGKDKDNIRQTLTQQHQSVQQPLFRDSVVAELRRRGKIKKNEDLISRLITSLQS